MSLKEIARRLFRKAVTTPVVSAQKPLRARLNVEGLEDRTTPTVTISASASPTTAQVGEPINIFGSVTASEPMSSLTNTFFWGDGSTTSDPHTFSPGSSLCPISQSHAYTSAGTFTITLTANAVYEAGGTDSATATYTVTILPPTSPPPPPPPPPGPPPPPELARVQMAGSKNASESGIVGEIGMLRSGGDLTQPLTVFYSVSGTATPVNDYVLLASSVTFVANETSATVYVTAVDDLTIDPDETVTIVINDGPGYTVVTPAGIQTILIVDNEPLVGSGNGLLGRYFNAQDFRDLAMPPRIDATVDFDWGGASADPRVNTDHVSVRWTGQVQAQYTEEYTFKTITDDGVRLWVNGQKLIDNWTDHSAKTDTSNVAISMTAGSKYDIMLEYYENVTDSVAKLLWKGAALQTEGIIPTTQLYPEQVTSPGDGTGNGLLGKYSNGQNLPPAWYRVDPTVNFDWGAGTPDAKINPDNFAVTWVGQVQPRFSGDYTFYTESDDGVRLEVAGKQIINDWTDHGPTPNQGAAVGLVAGTKYDIKLNYYENVGSALSRLFWSSDNQTREIIPQTQLYAPANHAPYFVAAGNPTTTYSFTLGLGSVQGSRAGKTVAIDPDADPLVYTITSGNAAGFFVMSGNSIQLVGDLPEDAVGPITLTVQADDLRGGIANATVTISLKTLVLISGDLFGVAAAGSTDNVRLDFTRWGNINQALTVNYTVGWRTANPTDLLSDSGTLTGSIIFTSGARIMPVALTPKRPGTFTEIKYFDVKLTEGTDYTTHFENDTNRTYKKKKVKFIGQDTATVTIIPKIAADLFGPDNTTADLQDGNAVGANPNDIFQSQLPDCAPMAVFASLAKNPAKLKALFTILPDGNVKIRFYPLGGGAPVDITVPMTLDFGADTPRLSGDTNAAGGIEIWPQILHTAYRQFLTQTGQPDIGTGRSPSDTLFHLTGIQSSTSSLLKDLTVEQIQQQITDGLAANKPIYLVTPTQQPGDPPITFGIFIIYYWHTFTVIGLNADGKAIIYNPHGGGTAAQAIMSFAEIKTTFMSNTSLTVAQSAF